LFLVSPTHPSLSNRPPVASSLAPTCALVGTTETQAQGEGYFCIHSQSNKSNSSFLKLQTYNTRSIGGLGLNLKMVKSEIGLKAPKKSLIQGIPSSSPASAPEMRCIPAGLNTHPVQTVVWIIKKIPTKNIYTELLRLLVGSLLSQELHHPPGLAEAASPVEGRGPPCGGKGHSPP
jgi:hypothetical protein